MKSIFLAASLVTFLSTNVSGQAMSHDAMEKMSPASSMGKQRTSSSLTEGTVTKVDRPSGTITLRHLEVKSVGMPAMTMAYKAKDSAMLDKVAPGDKVGFSLEQQQDKKYVIDAIERNKGGIR